jgi:GT2 family glycosyltransferase
MIPALGIAFYNRFDLLRRCLESVDHPVEHLFLVNNGPYHAAHAPQRGLENVVREVANPLIANVDIVNAGRNLGVAGAWNHMQWNAFESRHLNGLLLCGNDITWQSGDLAIFAKTVEEFPEADFVFGNHSYSNFYIRRSGWDKVGAFDENIEMAYLEDSDHWQRILRTPGVKAIHAAGLRALHEGSATIKSDAEYAARVSAQHDRNWTYYARKWGCPKWSSGAETFKTPFDQGGPINDWKLDAARQLRPHYFKENPAR